MKQEMRNEVEFCPFLLLLCILKILAELYTTSSTSDRKIERLKLLSSNCAFSSSIELAFTLKETAPQSFGATSPRRIFDDEIDYSHDHLTEHSCNV
jgi:hypothetical protein